MSHRQTLDLSCIQLDGSHSPAQRGGEAVVYQGRKSSQTSNTLYLADNQGQMLACASPQAGQHHDLFKIQELFEQICDILQEADIDLSGLFLNADAGFDSQDVRQLCSQKGIEANIEQNKRNQKTVQEHVDYQYFDEELYKRRTVIEHANAWMDNFKALLIRFETKAKNWTALLFIGFTVRFLTKIYKKRKL